PGSLLLDIAGVAHLFGGEAKLAETILRELAARGHSVRAAAADTIGAAWAVAHFGNKDEGGRIKDKDEERRKEDCKLRTANCKLQIEESNHPSSFILHPSSFILVPPGQTLSVLRPLPIEALRLPEPTVTLLRQLGIWRIEQLEALPRHELPPRFGPQLLEHWDRAAGRLDEPLSLYQPPPRFAVGHSPEPPTARRETIDAMLVRLADRLCEMLRPHGLGAVQVECRLECTAGDPLEVSVGLFHPTARARHLVQLLQVRLERLRLPAPVRHVRLAATATAPLELRQQGLFSEPPACRHPRHLAGLIDRLSNRLGQHAVVRPRLVPDAQPEMACRYVPMVKCRRLRVHRGHGAKPQAARPVRLLTRPVLLTAGRPCFAQTWGPERIETGWWRGQAVGRDYYRVETTDGRRFWIFRNLEDNRWFLHGVFD
ncbi:MAG: DNA polymerase Y family protein, partial [Thermoguttaceae bacterium]